jgi:starch phosphorylase
MEQKMANAFDTFLIKSVLPPELEPLRELAYNLHWTWNYDTIELFRLLDRDLWRASGDNPVKMLGTIKQEKLSQALNDEGFMAQLDRVYRNLQDYLTGPTWFESKYGEYEKPVIGYFSMEYGLTECLPIYSGGLGILAGDHLKSASELGVPLAGVGLLYQQGYFQQYLNIDGWQQETYPDNDFYNLPIELVRNDNGAPETIEVDFPGRDVRCRIWKLSVGRVPLYLLDTNTPENDRHDRRITQQLYSGDKETRIQQELILGIGGMKALRKLDIHAHVCHMNEGHAAFMALERMRHRVRSNGLTPEEAAEIVKSGTIFTTHTPVPAGIDLFHPMMVEKYLNNIYRELGMKKSTFLGLGRYNPDDEHEQFNMALLALKTTAFANGVSILHGDTSRKLFQSIWPDVPLQEIPINHITNGIHTRSWVSHEMAELFSRYLGPNWLKKPADQSVWQRVEKIPDVELWRVHERRRDRLVAFSRRRAAEQFKRRGAGAKEIDAASEVLNPEALTIGFARRFATYKRATLLLRDPQRLKRLLTNPQKPVQIIFSGKAHPLDNGGKEFIKQIVHFARNHDVRNHIIFLENYDISVARCLVQGVDLWVNTPRRPHEASGTSGMKVVPNGGLNLSILDGWWCEGYDGELGWAIGAGEEYDDQNYQDEIESKALYDVLENEVIPLFYNLSSDGLPHQWIQRIKKSIIKLAPVFSTNRMVQEYTEKYYMRARDNWKNLSSENYQKSRDLVKWKHQIRDNWALVKIVNAGVQKKEVDVGYELKVEAEVKLGQLKPEDIQVQTLSGPLDSDYNLVDPQIAVMTCSGPSREDIFKYEGQITCDESGLRGYSLRVLPHNPDMTDQFGLEHMRWIGESQTPTHHEKYAARV